MTGPSTPRTPSADPQDRLIRRTWWFLAGSFFVLGLAMAARLGTDGARPLDYILAGLAVLVGLAAILHRDALRAYEVSRREEAESFARILQGLSRSVSPDAIVDAIVEDLGRGTGADHIVVVRRRPEVHALEATLVSSRPGVRSSTTLFPLSDLDDPDRSAPDDREPVGFPVGDQGHEQLAWELAAVHTLDRGPFEAWRDPIEDATAAGAARRDGRVASARGWAGRTVRDATRAGRSLWPAVVPLRSGGRPREGRDSAALSSGAAARITDRIATRTRSMYGLNNTIAAPLRGESGVLGAIVLSRRTDVEWSASSKRILAGAAVEASAALARAFSHREAEARASTDPLTGLPNRRYFDEFCGLLARRRRADDAVGVLMIDIDQFKLVNDVHGHAVGDEVLRRVATAIAGAVREDDVPTRFGGEEFAVLLRNPGPGVAIEVGERVRDAVARLDLRKFRVGGVSVSVGVAVARAPDEPIGELVEQADRALYEAKRAGRDRVVAA
ncbi:MAG TPA: GGDEF domain-containing protein [Candidatus Limnocylindrales bacterium]|nr:GGDEF domain-containing protein [Candidatus Limnocylindrales bacterium]